MQQIPRADSTQLLATNFKLNDYFFVGELRIHDRVFNKKR